MRRILLLPLILLLIFLAAVFFLNRHLSNNRQPGVYEDQFLSFRYPKDWLERNREEGKTSRTVYFKSPEGIYLLRYTVFQNQTEQGNLIYQNLVDSFLGLPAKDELKDVYLDGELGLEWDLHNANIGGGGKQKEIEENSISHTFFSKDKKRIYTLDLKIAASDWGRQRTGVWDLEQLISTVNIKE